MKIFFLRLLFIFVLVFFEFSFLDILFPWISAPIVLIDSIVAWALLVSFPRVLFMTIPLTAFFDIVSPESQGILTLYAVLLVYMMSFLSRRLLLEYRGINMALYALLSSLGVLGFTFFEFIFSQGNPFLWTKEIVATLSFLVPFRDVFFSMLLCIPLFICVYFLIRWFEKYMDFIIQGETLQMK